MITFYFSQLPPLRNMENPDDFDVIGSDIPGIPDPKPTDGEFYELFTVIL